MRDDRPSTTALQVALAVPYIAYHRRYGRLLAPDLIEAAEDMLMASGAVSQARIERMQRPGYRLMGSLFERVTVPGLTLHLALRKRWVGEEVETAIAEGARQVVVLGAGLDPLCHRLAPRYPEVRWIEIDHPASQGLKRKALDLLGANENHVLVPADLSRVDLETTIRGIEGWDQELPTVLVAEGLLMYLTEEDVTSFFNAAAQASGPGSRIVFSYLQRTAGGRFLLGPYGGLAQLGLRLQGEAFHWGIESRKLPEFLAGHGWSLLPADRFDLRRRYLEPAGLGRESLARVEKLAVAGLAIPG